MGACCDVMFLIVCRVLCGKMVAAEVFLVIHHFILFKVSFLAAVFA